jgi:hypothetical protein
MKKEERRKKNEERKHSGYFPAFLGSSFFSLLL